MKNKYNIICYIMAIIIAIIGVGPAGGVVFANTNVVVRLTDFKINTENGQVSEGDVFDAEVRAVFNSPISEEEYREVYNREIRVSGDVRVDSGYVVKTGITNSENLYTGIDIKIEGIECAKTGGTIEITFGDAETTFTMERPAINASEGLMFINPETINLVANERQQISLQVKNIASTQTKKGNVTLKIVDKEAAKHIKLKRTEFEVPSIMPNSTKELTTTVDISSSIARGSYDLSVAVDGKEHIVKLKVDSNFMPPSLTIDARNTSGLTADKTEKITLSIKNVGHVAAKNVKLTMDGAGEVIITEGSNVRYIENINSNAQSNVDIKLKIVDKKATSVPLTMTLTYLDDMGKELTETQVIYLSTNGVTESVVAADMSVIN
ncbi:MAG: CARDB domain-containing protein, partial [Cellulosilyticaceae bacterium]